MAENSTTSSISYEFTRYSTIPLIIICILGAASNALLLLAFIKNPLKCFRNSGTYLVMNLSVSDCLCCVTVLFIFTKITANDLRLILRFITYYFGGVSFLSITSISIDRFLMVAYPIKHRTLMSGKTIIPWIAAIWTVISVAIPLLVLQERINRTTIISTLSMFAVTLAAIMYSSTYHKLKKQSKNIVLQNSNETRAEKVRILKERRFLNTIIIIAGVSFSCVVFHLLFYLSYYSLGLSKDKLVYEVVFTTSRLLFYSNFAVNPLIYILRLPNYRKTFYLLYCRRRTDTGFC